MNTYIYTRPSDMHIEAIKHMNDRTTFIDYSDLKYRVYIPGRAQYGKSRSQYRSIANTSRKGNTKRGGMH